MYLTDMDEVQLKEEKMFVEMLSQAHWAAQEVSDMLHAGMSVYPEGSASLELEDTILVLNYYAGEHSIIFVISAKISEKAVRLKFEYGEHLAKLLEWVIRNQYLIDVQSFAKLLKDVYAYCEKVFLIGNDGNSYLIEAP